MRFAYTDIPGVIQFSPQPKVDERGYFSRTFDAKACRRAGVDPAAFLQDSTSRSYQGVIRGLHVRVGEGEAKLVRCSAGEIFDVVVDLRSWSPSYRRWLTFHLSDSTQSSIYVPPGCAHGFQALSSSADTSYRIDRAYDPFEDVTIAFDDPELGIPWPMPPTLMSLGDRLARPLAALSTQLERIKPRVA